MARMIAGFKCVERLGQTEMLSEFYISRFSVPLVKLSKISHMTFYLLHLACIYIRRVNNCMKNWVHNNIVNPHSSKSQLLLTGVTMGDAVPAFPSKKGVKYK